MTDECHLLCLKRLESGAFVKYYGGLDKELEQAVRMCLPEVASEDPRFLKRRLSYLKSSLTALKSSF